MGFYHRHFCCGFVIYKSLQPFIYKNTVIPVWEGSGITVFVEGGRIFEKLRL